MLFGIQAVPDILGSQSQSSELLLRASQKIKNFSLPEQSFVFPSKIKLWKSSLMHLKNPRYRDKFLSQKEETKK